jgi:hypothetical protein
MSGQIDSEVHGFICVSKQRANHVFLVEDACRVFIIQVRDVEFLYVHLETPFSVQEPAAFQKRRLRMISLRSANHPPANKMQLLDETSLHNSE